MAETFEHRLEKAKLMMEASERHLERVKQLSDREWRTDVLFWGALLLSGSTLIGFAAKAENALSVAIVTEDWIVITGYLISTTVYLLGIAGNTHRSLVTERNRYQVLQDRALALMNIRDARIQTEYANATSTEAAFRSIDRKMIYRNSVWGAKMIATWMMVSAIWTLSQVAGHYGREQQKWNVEHACQGEACVAGKPAPTVPFDGSSVDLLCAFERCDKVPKPADLPGRMKHLVTQGEAGTYIWLLGTFLFLGLGIRAFTHKVV